MTSILIQSANVLDVETLKFLPDTDVWVKDGQIQAVGPKLPVPEGARVIDTRDWDDEEVQNLLAEIFTSVLPGTSETDFLEMFKVCVPEYYC